MNISAVSPTKELQAFNEAVRLFGEEVKKIRERCGQLKITIPTIGEEAIEGEIKNGLETAENRIQCGS